MRQLVKDVAAFCASCDAEGQHPRSRKKRTHFGKAFPSDITGDGPPTRAPKRQDSPQLPRAPAPSPMLFRAPKRTKLMFDGGSRPPIQHLSPRHEPPEPDTAATTPSTLTRLPPTQKQRGTIPKRYSELHTREAARQLHFAPLVTPTKVTYLADFILSAYPADSPYRIQPPNNDTFLAMIEDTQQLTADGVPVSTESGERSAWKLYWEPYCAEVGMSPFRPPYSELTPAQQRVEDNLKAIALPYISLKMPGRKHAVALPTSAMASLRAINRRLNRENDDNVQLRKAMTVLKGILTRYVAEYGPILPDQSLPIPKPMLAALFTLPTGTKLGSRSLNLDDQGDCATKTACELAAESGCRLDELTVGQSKTWDKRKMSRASVVWFIAGQYWPSSAHPFPSPTQLKSLTEVDGACATPACSKCDRWGNKHGSKTIFLPFRPSHTYNAARALRDYELKFPCTQNRDTTPLFQSADGKPLAAAYVRTLLYHMLRTPQVRAAAPHADITKYSFHSFRRTFATGLARAGASRERIQSMCRWLSVEAVDLYDKLTFADHCMLVDAAYLNSSDTITPCLLRQLQSTKIDDNDTLASWCKECHIDVEKMPTPLWS